MATRSVDYAMTIVSELPDPTPSAGPSPLEDQLADIVDNTEYHFPLWARIGKYTSAEHVAAAGAAASILRRRHGDDETVEGWRFETRRIDNGTASGLFAQYNPKEIVPGKAEQNKVVYEAWRRRQAEAARQRNIKRAEKNAAQNGNDENMAGLPEDS